MNHLGTRPLHDQIPPSRPFMASSAALGNVDSLKERRDSTSRYRTVKLHTANMYIFCTEAENPKRKNKAPRSMYIDNRLETPGLSRSLK